MQQVAQLFREYEATRPTLRLTDFVILRRKNRPSGGSLGQEKAAFVVPPLERALPTKKKKKHSVRAATLPPPSMLSTHTGLVALTAAYHNTTGGVEAKSAPYPRPRSALASHLRGLPADTSLKSVGRALHNLDTSQGQRVWRGIQEFQDGNVSNARGIHLGDVE